MKSLIAGFFRAICYPIVSTPLLYIPGMILVRISRKLRTWFYSKEAQPEKRVVRFAGNLKMEVDRNSYMGGSIYWTGVHHLQELLYLKTRLKEKMVFVDVGANQGEFSLFAASRLPHGKVLSFEPVTSNLSALKQNIHLNGFSRITLFPFGLSDQPGSFNIYTSLAKEVFHGQHEGLSTLYPTAQRNTLEETITLEVFDEVFKTATQPIDFVKIDVEGAELSVLKGMQRHLAQFKPELMIEINEETFNAAGYTTQDISAFLQTLGYVPYSIWRGRLIKTSYTALSKWGNYIFRVEA
jgi:FkbM family methyltransferase